MGVRLSNTLQVNDLDFFSACFFFSLQLFNAAIGFMEMIIATLETKRNDGLWLVLAAS